MTKVHDDVIARERELLTAECRANRERIEPLLHADFREYGASGRVWTRGEILVATQFGLGQRQRRVASAVPSGHAGSDVVALLRT